MSDKSLGLVEVVAEFYPEAAWQRCMVHWFRNVRTVVRYNQKLTRRQKVPSWCCMWRRWREIREMLTRRDHRSGVLFDPWEYLGPQRRKLLEQSWAGVFRDYLLQHLPVKELATSFQDDFGRPSKDLSVALGALILQQLHDLTDQQTTEAVALNIAWHYALDIRHDPDAYLCERTLHNYRRRILELGLEEVLFRTCCSCPRARRTILTKRPRRSTSPCTIPISSSCARTSPKTCRSRRGRI